MSEEKKPGKIWLNVLLVVFYALVFIFLLYNSFAYLDPDFGWHLKMGEQIWQTHAVPDINHEDYTLLGTHWVDMEWLSEAALYLVYHYFGYIVLSIMFALLFLAALLIQLAFTRKYFLDNDRGLFFVLLLQAFGAYASLPLLGVRVQEITVLCLLLLTIIIYLYQKKRDYRLLLWLIPLFLFWASAHGGFFIGLVVLALFTVVKAGELWSAQKFPFRFIDYSRILNWQQVGVFAGFSLAALAATFATPYGWRLYQFSLGLRDTYFQAHLSEWQGQYAFPFIYPQLFFVEIVLIWLAFLLVTVFILKGDHYRKVDLYELILLLLFTVMAIMARRHFPLLFIVSLPIIAQFFINFFKFSFSRRTPPNQTSLGTPPPRKSFLDFIFLKKKKSAAAAAPALAANRNFFNLNNLLLIFLSLVLLLAGTLVFFKINFTNHPEKTYQNAYPYAAVAFLRSHPEWNDLNIFNDYGWGGYLIWQYPERKLFGDGRLPEYPLHGGTVLEEYGAFLDKQKMAGQLQYYDIGLVLINPKEDYPVVKNWEKWYFSLNEGNITNEIKDSFGLLDYLRGSAQWHSVYNDGTAEIFVRTNN